MSSTTTRTPSIHAVSENSPEAQVVRRMESYFAACRNGDLDEIISFYTPDIVAYDMPPHLRRQGRGAYRESWEQFFTSVFEFPVVFETREQKVYASGDLALVHGLMRVSGRFKATGEEAPSWVRHTLGFRKIGEEWMIFHEHNSVPIAMDGHAMMNVDPDTDTEIETTHSV